MSETEEFFLFVQFYNQTGRTTRNADSYIVRSEFQLIRVSRQRLDILGENCKRIPVDFDPLIAKDCYVVCIHHKMPAIPYTYVNMCNNFVITETEEQALTIKREIEDGGHKKLLEENHVLDHVNILQARISNT